VWNGWLGGEEEEVVEGRGGDIERKDGLWGKGVGMVGREGG